MNILFFLLGVFVGYSIKTQHISKHTQDNVQETVVISPPSSSLSTSTYSTKSLSSSASSHSVTIHGQLRGKAKRISSSVSSLPSVGNDSTSKNDNISAKEEDNCSLQSPLVVQDISQNQSITPGASNIAVPTEETISDQNMPSPSSLDIHQDNAASHDTNTHIEDTTEEYIEVPSSPVMPVNQPETSFYVGDKAKGEVVGELEVVDDYGNPLTTAPLKVHGSYTLDFIAPGEVELSLDFTSPAVLSVVKQEPTKNEFGLILETEWLYGGPLIAAYLHYRHDSQILDNLYLITEINGGIKKAIDKQNLFLETGIGLVYKW